MIQHFVKRCPRQTRIILSKGKKGFRFDKCNYRFPYCIQMKNQQNSILKSDNFKVNTPISYSLGSNNDLESPTLSMTLYRLHFWNQWPLLRCSAYKSQSQNSQGIRMYFPQFISFLSGCVMCDLVTYFIWSTQWKLLNYVYWYPVKSKKKFITVIKPVHNPSHSLISFLFSKQYFNKCNASSSTETEYVVWSRG